MTIHDEQDLRDRLRAVSAATPPAPPERVDAAVRLAGSIKRRRAAVAAVAVLVPAAAFGVGLTRPAPPAGYASPASWPDRRDPALADLEEAAIASWRDAGGLLPGERVRWLWSGRVPATGNVAMAFATCAGETCSRVVLQRGDEDLLREPRLPATSWDTTTWDVPPGGQAPPLSEYFETDATYDSGPRTVLFVLPSPDAAEVAYETPVRGEIGGAAGSLEPLRGAFTGDVGYLVGDATITVRDEGGTALYTGQVGDQDSVGSAELISGTDLPPGFEERTTDSGQVGRAFNGKGTERNARERLALFVRCAGRAPLDVTFEGQEERVPCDGATHQVGDVTPFHAPFDVFEYRAVSTDPYAVYAATLAEPVT